MEWEVGLTCKGAGGLVSHRRPPSALLIVQSHRLERTSVCSRWRLILRRHQLLVWGGGRFYLLNWGMQRERLLSALYTGISTSGYTLCLCFCGVYRDIYMCVCWCVCLNVLLCSWCGPHRVTWAVPVSSVWEEETSGRCLSVHISLGNNYKLFFNPKSKSPL